MLSSLEPADEQYAARVAVAVLASFMQQPQDRPTMLRLLKEMLVGEPKVILQRMVDPRTGVASQEEFFSLAAVKKWLNEHSPQPTWKPLPHIEEEPLDPEERAECSTRLKQLAQIIRETADTKTVSKLPKPIQIHNPSKLLEALENLESMNRKAEEDAI